MITRLWPLAIAFIAPPILIGAQEAPSADVKTSPVTSNRLVGAGSCAASACHNNSKGDTGNEHGFWITRDPHAKAYQILFDKPAIDIQKKLHRSVAAHEDQRCLNCHASPDYDAKHPPKDAAYFKTDGVSCESCHGPAKNWINEHHLEAWRHKSVDDKKSLGMNDTISILGRAQTCVKCHVGAAGMDVDHDLIAAGHPRLNFEFAAFHAGLPQHWPSAKDRASPRGGPDWDARLWIVGQLVSAQAALELLAERAANETRPWPEFAEHDCAACHHPLHADSALQKKGFGTRKPGAMPWGNYVAMTPIALKSFGAGTDPALQARVGKFHNALAALQNTMDRAATPDRKIVAVQAKEAGALLKPLVVELNRKMPARVPMDKLFNDILTLPDPKLPASADAVTQIHLGLAALQQARHEMKSPPPADLQEALRGLSLRMHLPRGYDVAGSYNPDSIRKRLK